ncbi:ESX secretion-associated protein EspG [Nocardia arthritidis]|uniref:ESX secretion-associated protein EspG n=1 Tax=Nocardia arthritidis TaxID=228602 RepID=A0A6G9Y6S9_9NOCA|nr:ESX secretion-associated protein EspG [Nocardia arthritidis]QIS08810.1 ESX secretion-associated protein EspG [Nocardia arthritidis]
MHTWRFTGLEFEILCAAHERDRLPYPLRFRSETTDLSGLKRQRDAAAEALLGKHTDELERALQALFDPEVRIELKGFGGPNVYRFHGAVQGQAGTAVAQSPGTAPDTGGDVLMSYGNANHVATLAVTALPRIRAGAQPPIEIRREDLAADRDRYVREPYEISVTRQLDRIFKRERLGFGEITVFAGPAIDARPGFGRGFWWMDYADGRYYVKTGDPIIAKPIDPAAMAAEINRLTTLTQRYYREDQEHDEYLRSQPRY